MGKIPAGWLNYQVASAGKKAEFKLGPAETNTKQAQGLFVILPKKSVISNIRRPYEGAAFYYSGAGDDLDQLHVQILSPCRQAATLTAKVQIQYRIGLGLCLCGLLDR